MVDPRRRTRAKAYWLYVEIGGGVWRRQTHDYSTVTVLARLRG